MNKKQPKLKFEEDKERTATRSPPKKEKVEQTQPRKKLKLDADKAAEKAQHLRFGKAEITPDEASRMTKAQKREMYASAIARSAAHREVDQYEDDNVGTQALNEGLKTEESAADFSKSRYSRKLKKKAKLQAKKKLRATKSSAHEPDKVQNAGEANVIHSDSGEGGSNWLSRWRQKQDVRKSYYAAARSGGTAAQTAGGQKITSSGAGSKLMQNPEQCGRMVAAARGALGPDKPLTVKMRIGWDAEQLTGVAVARQCETNGADLITVHGRTREQMYIPPIDVDAITEIRKAVGIPVLANGDITTAEGAKQILEQTGCAGVMIGRGALGDPWLFERVNAAIEGLPAPKEPNLQARMNALRRQVEEMVEQKGEFVAMPQARAQTMHYMKGLKGASALRRYCCELSHLEDIDTLIEAVFDQQRRAADADDNREIPFP